MKDTYDEFDSISGAFSETINHSAANFYQRYGKRFLDLTLALLLVPFLAPIIGILWLLARRDGGPGFFGHKRIGKGGGNFRCWKIRTMVVDAEQKLHAYLLQNPDAAAEWRRDQKLSDDPRVIRLGRFLRRTSLDELPQLLNVLKGEMSFVGPRPIVRDEILKYGVASGVYLSQKPSITGLWQVSGRNDVTYHERVSMDIKYVQSISALTDIRIIALTGTSVIGLTGR